jgi:hypothetical protein
MVVVIECIEPSKGLVINPTPVRRTANAKWTSGAAISKKPCFATIRPKRPERQAAASSPGPRQSATLEAAPEAGARLGSVGCMTNLLLLLA